MRPNDPTPSASASERAALYVSGALAEEECEAVRRAVAAGDQELAAELQRLRGVGAALAGAVQPAAAPAHLREAVLARAAAERLAQPGQQAPAGNAPHRPEPSPQVWREWSDDAAVQPLFTLRGDDGRWEETGVSGVMVRRLFVDRAANRMTAMFRMAPGTAYPRHVHDGPEECYVLQGDLHVGDELVMHGGDYQRAGPGSVHGRQWTEHGCLLLVTSSLTDALV